MAGRPAVLKVDIVSDAKGVNKGVAEADSGFSKLGKGAGLAGKAIGLGMAAAGVAVVGFGISAVKSASDAQQAVGAVESVFGSASKAVEQYASTSANRLGLSGTAYRNLASVVGSQLKNMGRSTSEAAKDSDKLVTIGADLAATFGGSVEDAVGAVGSLLRGERDPIERYGVAIKQSDINARLAALGQDKLTGAARRTAEANITLALLTQQTAGAQGAFARESDTLAGAQARVGAQFEDVKAKIGAGLLPILTTMFTFIGQQVIPNIQVFAAELSTRLGPTISAVGAFITGQLVPAAAVFYDWFINKIAPGIVRYVTPIIAGIRSGFASLAKAIEDNKPQLIEIGNRLKVVAEFIAQKVAPVIGTVLGGAFQVLGVILGTTLRLIINIADAFSTVYEWVIKLVAKFQDSSVGKALGAIGKVFDGSPVGMVAAPMGAAPTLMGPGGGMAGPSSFAYSPFAWGGLSSLLTGSSARPGGLAVVAPTTNVSVNIYGALDPTAVARQVDDVLRAQAQRTGALGTYRIRSSTG